MKLSNLIISFGVLCVGQSCLSKKMGKEGENKEITGTTWQLESLADTVLSRAAPYRMSLQLGSNGRATGTLICNFFNGSYVIRKDGGEHISFSGLTSTWKACKDKEGDERYLLEMLAKTTRIERDKDKGIWLCAENKRLMKWKPS